MTELPSDLNAGSNQQTYDRLTLSLQLGLRRQLLIAVCDDPRERDRFVAQLQQDLGRSAPSAGTIYPSVVTLVLDLGDPNPIAQIAQWLNQYPPPIIGGQRATMPIFQIVGIEQLTRQSLVVQRLFFNYLQNVERNLPRLESGIVFWMPRPWVNGLPQSAPEFWRCRTAVFEFIGDPMPTTEVEEPVVSTAAMPKPTELPFEIDELLDDEALPDPTDFLEDGLDVPADLLAELTADLEAIAPLDTPKNTPQDISQDILDDLQDVPDDLQDVPDDDFYEESYEEPQAYPHKETQERLPENAPPAIAQEINQDVQQEEPLVDDQPMATPAMTPPVLPPPPTGGIPLPLSQEELWTILHHDLSQQMDMSAPIVEERGEERREDSSAEPESQGSAEPRELSPAEGDRPLDMGWPEAPAMPDPDQPDYSGHVEDENGRSPRLHRDTLDRSKLDLDDRGSDRVGDRVEEKQAVVAQTMPRKTLTPYRPASRPAARQPVTVLQAVRKTLRQSQATHDSYKSPSQREDAAVSVVDRVANRVASQVADQVTDAVEESAAAEAPAVAVGMPLPVQDLDPSTLHEQIERLHKQHAPPALLANAYRTLGNVYRDRIEQGLASAEDLKAAIQAYEQVLVWLHETSPLWADVLNDLGNLYWMLSRQSAGLDEVLSTLQQGIQAYQLALNKINIQTQVASYTMVQSNLGAAYGDLARYQDTADNLQRSIQAYQQALRYRKPDDEPQRYALTQNNLGTTYWNLAQHQQPKIYLKQAIAAYSEALRYYSPESEPMNHAMIQNNLGTAYWNLAQHERPREWLMLSLAAYRTALRYRTRQTAPVAYAATQNNLGTAYWHLANHAKDSPDARLDYLQQAIAAYKSAVAIVQHLKEAGPDHPPLNFDIFATHNNLGLAHYQLGSDRQIQLDTAQRQTHMESALEYHLEALAGWEHRPDLREATLKCVLQAIRTAYTQGGISGQNLALSKVPGHLLPELLPQL